LATAATRTLHDEPKLTTHLSHPALHMQGGVIMDVVTPEEARIAEEAGAVAVMALERVPADIRRNGGVARMSDPQV
jgi:pyridoxal 5'-phosphate synthase pdxS subunit